MGTLANAKVKFIPILSSQFSETVQVSMCYICSKLTVATLQSSYCQWHIQGFFGDTVNYTTGSYMLSDDGHLMD